MERDNDRPDLMPGITNEAIEELHNEQNGVPVIGISRHRLGTDGNGVTTLVAFHGCNLRCKYCLNPEALGSADGLSRYTPESLYEKVKVDDLYFRATGGGITFGGGEPCLQADFIVRFKELCGKDWKIRVETSLQAPFHNIEKLVSVVDEWIVDIKTDDREIYEKYTGQKYISMYQHLRWLMWQVGYNSNKIILRIPIIPGFTDVAMVEETKKNFELYGISRFNLFTYRTERPKKFRSMIEGLEPGKAKCKLLKVLRKDLADRYGIQMRERVCTHEGDCPGTCPLCEAELESLTQQIKVIAPNHLEISSEIMERCQLNKSFSSSEIDTPETEVPDREPLGMEREYRPLGGDVELPTEDGEILPPGLPEPPKFEFKKVFFKECAVAGLSFHLEKDDELWDELYEGTKIALIRDRNNKYDKNAVAVALADDYDGDPDGFDFDCILGYLPRTENVEIAAMMDAGYADKFEAEITSYHRHGKYEDRIRITIWLLSLEPIEVRPNLLRMQSLGLIECKAMFEELQKRGTVHFRWGFFNEQPLNLPIVGEEVVLMRRQGKKVLLFLMKVIAEGENCAPFLDDPDEIYCVDDRATFVLTNIVGPETVDLMQVAFLDVNTLGNREVYDWLSEDEDKLLRELFDKRLNEWQPQNKIEEDPSLDDPKGIDTIQDVIDWISKENYTFCYRDTSAQIVLSDYTPGTILRAGFTVDACDKFYKPARKTRFLIVGSHTINADSEFPKDWRLVAFGRNTHFMVVDVYTPEYSDYRQILLVQLPEEYTKFDQSALYNAVINMRGPYPQCAHGNVVPAARYDFDSKLKSTIFPRQKDKALVELMKRPIGLIKKGKQIAVENPYNEKQLVRDFIAEHLNGDIRNLSSFQFSSLKEDKKYGHKAGPNVWFNYAIVRALFSLAFEDKWPDLCVETLDDYTYEIAPIIRYQRLFGSYIDNHYFLRLDQHRNIVTEDLVLKAKTVANLCDTIGNLLVWPNKSCMSQIYDDWKMRGYFDRMISAMYATMTGDGKEIDDVKCALNANRPLMHKFQGRDGFERFIQHQLLNEFVGRDFKPLSLFKGISIAAKDFNPKELPEAINEYYDFCSHFIPQRTIKIIEIIKQKI